jgi:hypothetical protein
MAMKLVSQKAFERAPEVARPQMPPVICGEHDLSLVAAGSDLVRTSKRRDAAFDPEALLDHFELHEMGRLNDLDALHQMSSVVRALEGGSNAGLVALGPHRVWQQDTQEEWRAHGDLLVQQHSLPNRFGAGVQVNRGRDHLSRCVSREQPTHEAEPPPCMWLRSPRRRARARNGYVVVLSTGHLEVSPPQGQGGMLSGSYFCRSNWIDSTYFTLGWKSEV